MITESITWILFIIGVATSSMVGQFLAPKKFLRLVVNIEINDEAGLFYAKHWAMMVFVLGGLLIWAAFDETIRTPVILAAVLEKLVLVYMVLTNMKTPIGRGLLGAAAFDAVSSSILILYLTGAA
ncbi:MAG: hypothetical protein COB04_03845 [Gammaproteobacteria bacterium]|nr:MAG: hypothetical protein COB04_03845 [Gammaproteobacteria bacterium]